MCRKIKKGASFGVIGQHSPKYRAENAKAESTHAQDKTNSCVLHCHARRLITGLYGKPLRLQFPCGQSANLRGSARSQNAMACDQNAVFVPPYCDLSSPPGIYLMAVPEPISRKALHMAKFVINRILAQVTGALNAIAEHENLVSKSSSQVCYSNGLRSGSATDLLIVLIHLNVDMNPVTYSKQEGNQ